MKRWSLVVAAAIALSSHVASAQTPPDTEPAGVDEATRSSARELGEQGNALYAAGDYAGALEKYERAYALVPVPPVGVRIARSLVALGRLVEASERYLAVQRAGLPPHPLPVHERALEDAKTEREALTPRIPALVITVEPSGANVTVDGAPLPAALLGEKRVVDPGHHTVIARVGEASRSVEVDVVEGAVMPVHVALEGVHAERPAPTTAGREAAPRGNAWPVVGWVTLGVGGATTLVGVATGLVAMGQQSDLEASCGAELACPPALHDDADGYNGMRTISAVTFFAGLGLAAAGATILVLDPGGASETLVSAGPGQVAVTGHF